MTAPPVANLKDHIFALAERTPKKPALVSCDQEGETEKIYTYQDLKDDIVKVGDWLQHDLKLKKGEALGLALPNSAELLILSWAAWAVGIITVPFDLRRDTFSQYLYKVSLTRLKALIVRDQIFKENEMQELRKTLNVVVLQEFEALQASEQSVAWQDGISHSALILFTSGTTGFPKGAELTLENLLVNAQGIKDWLEIADQDRFLVLLPLYHVNSTTFCLASLLAGASIAVCPGYSNSKFWQQLAKTQSTFTSIVPTICYDQVSRTQEFAGVQHTLKVTRIQIGSAPVVAHDVQRFMKLFHIPLYQGYGQTETALRVTGVPLSVNKQIYEQLVEENSIGKPMSWADVQIMDERGTILAEGQEGELAVKGLAVMKGYTENSEANKDAFKNGYFLTGDLGFYKLIDGVRYFFLKGRLKEIIIKGGVNLSPVAIENKLKQINENIDQAYVIGVPDARYGEEVAAVICWKEINTPIPQLQARFKYQLTNPLGELVSFEVPRYIASINASKLPITSTGKVQRSVLKKIIPQSAFQPVNLISANDNFQFVRLTVDDKLRAKQAFDLYNYCWQPLSLGWETFVQQLRNGVVLAGISKDNAVEGMITFFRTTWGESYLSTLTYKEVSGDFTLSTNQAKGDKIICVSICTKAYKPQAKAAQELLVPSPSLHEVQEYLTSGHDLTYNFHRKPKGGLAGANLVALLPNSRPEDRMSLGYNMLLRYPSLPQDRVIVPDPASSLAVQLMEAAMGFSQQLGIYEVYAFSRPAGAYQYFSKRV